MLIKFEFGKKTANNQYDYYIYKDNEKIGLIHYNVDENNCNVIDYDLQEVLSFEDKTIIDCVLDLAQGYINYYQNIGEEVTITNELLPF